jgi:DNA (cytosine-5)-methyltransferase 1
LSFKPGQSEAAGGTFITVEFAPTLQAQNNGSTAVPAVCSDGATRRLTPTECERLMGFPDGWTAIPWRGKPASECPDGLRYKALGNSMAVNCMRFIGERIALVDAVFSELEAASGDESEE